MHLAAAPQLLTLQGVVLRALILLAAPRLPMHLAAALQQPILLVEVRLLIRLAAALLIPQAVRLLPPLAAPQAAVQGPLGRPVVGTQTRGVLLLAPARCVCVPCSTGLPLKDTSCITCPHSTS